MLSLMDTIVSLVVKVLWKLISLICFRVYLEVNVHKNPTCFSRWSVSVNLQIFRILRVPFYCNIWLYVTLFSQFFILIYTISEKKITVFLKKCEFFCFGRLIFSNCSEPAYMWIPNSYND